jgi:hypothetical protein
MLGIEIDVGRRRVVRRPCVSDRSLYTHLLEAYVGMVNLRLGGAIRGKQRIIGWEGWEE